MTYAHTLNQVKAVLGIQQAFGGRRPHYDADHHQENGTWDRDNQDILWAGGRGWADGLSVEHGEASGRITFNMNSGDFIQSFKDPKRETFKADLDGFETFFGRASNVGYTIAGKSGNNYISTNDKSDYVDGGKGNDRIWAGAGDDIVRAGSGVDQIHTQDGRDTIITKKDFGFALIRDFEIGQDRLLIEGGMRNVTIKDFRDVDADSYLPELWDGGISENRLVNSAMVFKGDDLVAVVGSTEASDLSIVGHQIM